MTVEYAIGRPCVRSAFTVLPETPSCPPYELRAEMPWIDFSRTDNPCGTPRAFTKLIARAVNEGLAAYAPDREAHSLRSALAKAFTLPSECFLVGTTAPYMIRSVAQTFEPCGVGVALPCPAEHLLAIENAGHTIEPIVNPHSFVTPDARFVEDAGARIRAALLSNPGYPASRLLPKQTLLSYLEQCDWVVVDERSIELTLGGESMRGLVMEHRNLVIVQSFCEQYAMPGTPVSYCVAHPDTVKSIARFYDSSCVSLVAEVIAPAVPTEHARLESVRELLDKEIPWMQCMLSLVPGIEIHPAEANYVLCSFSNETGLHLGVRDAEELCARLQLAGFLVRTLARTPGLSSNDCFCVAVRAREDNEKLLEALRTIVLGR